MRNNAKDVVFAVCKQCFVDIISIIFITCTPHHGVRVYY